MNSSTTLHLLKQHFSLNPQTANVLIVGLGITGFSIARYLHALDIPFSVADSRENPPNVAELHTLNPAIQLTTGNFQIKDFQNATHLIISPGISLQLPIIQETLQRGAILISELDIFACATTAPIVAITGANGKSTVTTMLGDMATAAGKKTAVGGNLGTPMLDLLDAPVELYVLELSSFQLERCHLLNATAATVLNITADHLDRHVDMADYAAQKQKVFRGNGVMVLNADDAYVAAMYDAQRSHFFFSIQKDSGFHIAKRGDVEWLVCEITDFMPCADLPLEGRHNQANALAALALGTAIGLNKDAMCTALRQFVGLAHRMQKVALKNGISWVNDSKATNIGACVAALQGYDSKVILIAGGDAKGADMLELREVIAQKTKSVILMGKDAPLMQQAFSGVVPLYNAQYMDDAVACAARLAQNGDTVLLSPACASLDQYKNYQDRGNKFAAAVMALA